MGAAGAERGPSMSSRMFSGLTSRWTIWALCAAASPSATSAMIATAALGARRRSRSRRVRRSVPRTSVMTRARSLPSTTRSRTATTCGVVESEQGGALLHEAAHELLVGREVLTEQLDGDRALGPFAEPYRAGAAAPQDLVGRVPAADIPCQDCSLSGWRWTPGRQSYAAFGVSRAQDGTDLHFSGRNGPGEVDKETALQVLGPDRSGPRRQVRPRPSLRHCRRARRTSR